ncbi:MAG: glycosyltransferase family 9 protein [Chthoniobacterales bacterium]
MVNFSNNKRSRIFPGCYVAFHKQLGDLVLLEPSISRLRDFYGEPVRLMTRGSFRPVLKLMPGVRFVLGPPFIPASAAYCYDHLTKSATRTLFTPVMKRHAVLPEEKEITPWHRRIFSHIDGATLRDEYVAKYLWEHTPVPTEKAFQIPTLTAPPEKWRPAGIPEGGFILCSPTAGWQFKSWTAEYWAKTLKAAQDMTKLPVLILGASTDWQVEHAREIAALVGKGVCCLAGDTTLENFLWLTANAKIIFAVDGAASHLASAFRVRSVTVFGKTNERKWHWDTVRNKALRAPLNPEGEHLLRNLAPEPVIETAREIWING